MLFKIHWDRKTDGRKGRQTYTALYSYRYANLYDLWDFLYFKLVTDHSMTHVNGECKIWSCLPWLSYDVPVFAEENKWMRNSNISDTSPAWEEFVCQFPAWRLEDPIFSTIWDAVKSANFWTWDNFHGLNLA